MASSPRNNRDDRLVAGLIRQLISDEPEGLHASVRFQGFRMPPFDNRGARIKSEAGMAMGAADPAARQVAREMFATDAGPSALDQQRKSIAQTAHMLSGPNRLKMKLEDPLAQMRRDADRNSYRKRILKHTAMLDQEASRRRNLTARIMKIMKRQPGLGLLMLMGLGLPALIGGKGDK